MELISLRVRVDEDDKEFVKFLKWFMKEKGKIFIDFAGGGRIEGTILVTDDKYIEIK